MSSDPRIRSLRRQLAEKDALLGALRPEHSALLQKVRRLESGNVANLEAALADAEERLEVAEAAKRNAERSTVAYLAILLERAEKVEQETAPGLCGASFRFSHDDLFRAIELGARVRFEMDEKADEIVVRLAAADEAPAADPLAAQAVLAPGERPATVGLSTFAPETGTTPALGFDEEAPAGQRFGAARIGDDDAPDVTGDGAPLDEGDAPVAPV